MKIAKIILILFCLPLASAAQKWEVGLFAGGSNYLGDLAPDVVPGETRPVLGATIKRDFNSYFAISMNLNYGWIGGNDNNFGYLAPRNLSFRSNVVELSPQVEFNFFKFGTGIGAKRFSPYLYTGISVFHFDPMAKYDGEWYHLQPLRTEGQDLYDDANKPYSLTSVAIPIGAGFKFNLNDNWNLALHGAYHSTFTDYLDDVSGEYADRNLISESKGPQAALLSDRSGEKTEVFLGKPGMQRGSRDTRDWYIFAGFTLTYLLKGPICYEF